MYAYSIYWNMESHNMAGSARIVRGTGLAAFVAEKTDLKEEKA